MGFLDLFCAASMSVLKVLIVTALGSFLALDSIDILGQSTRKQINNIVFFVFNPALVGSNLASTITYESMISMWFMPVNIFLTYIIGSALGWVLLIIAKPPRHLKGLILGSCAAGNMGSMLLILLPAVCKETASPFGDPNICHEYSIAYASLSSATGAVYLWLYVYNLVRISSSHSQDSSSNEKGIVQEDLTQRLLPLPASSTNIKGKVKVMINVMKQNLGKISKHINLKAVFAPSTIGARSMGFLDLFCAASMSVLKVLIVTALGSFLALDSIDILGQSTRKQINNIVFFVFNPALVGSNLASTITYESMISMWFMPVNIFLTYIIGSALGWVLLIIAKPPRHLKGLILGSCAAAVCKETASPFGDPNICHEYSIAYASLSSATGAVYLWLYVYNLVRISSSHSQDSSSNEKGIVQEDLTQNLLPLPAYSTNIKGKVKVMINVMKQNLGKISKHVNLKAVFAPSTVGAIVGFMIGTVSPLRRLLIGTTAPLRVIQDSASLVGYDPSHHLSLFYDNRKNLRTVLSSMFIQRDASIPIMTLIVGGNLLRGLKGSGISLSHVFGIVVVKYVFLPIFGVLIVKSALYLGLVHADPLYVFILLLQFAVPPAMNTGTIVQLFGVGESECSVIMLWTYGLASVALTLWSTFFLWLVA
ncbi:auxin efflux carrier family protein [Artemisia annua]|uniref:Auxin efflux carrier family protein n=1 Tax=Artemisia annua TaxID=35608 RepID=A0A2U1MB22_ARTAN|nr:auxin efflux carrier family protein [Artemisia annua]